MSSNKMLYVITQQYKHPSEICIRLIIKAVIFVDILAETQNPSIDRSQSKLLKLK